MIVPVIAPNAPPINAPAAAPRPPPPIAPRAAPKAAPPPAPINAPLAVLFAVPSECVQPVRSSAEVAVKIVTVYSLFITITPLDYRIWFQFQKKSNMDRNLKRKIFTPAGGRHRRLSSNAPC